jgi:hypothetical protein
LCIQRGRADSIAIRETTTLRHTQASEAAIVHAHDEPKNGQVVGWNFYSGETGAAMTDATADEILAFVGSQFSGQGGTTKSADSLLPQKNDEKHETQGATTEGNAYRGMTPMERYLACGGQPLQMTIAQPLTREG